MVRAHRHAASFRVGRRMRGPITIA